MSWNECNNCDWMGGNHDTISYEEYKNNDRFKKLNEILNGKR